MITPVDGVRGVTTALTITVNPVILTLVASAAAVAAADTVVDVVINTATAVTDNNVKDNAAVLTDGHTSLLTPMTAKYNGKMRMNNFILRSISQLRRKTT